MIQNLAFLKQRFASGDKPSAKDFTDLIDTLMGNMVTDAHINALISAALSGLTASNTQIIASPTAPTVAYASSLWVQTYDSFGVTANRVFNYQSGDGNWHSRHPVPSGTIVAVTDLAKLGIATINNSSSYAAVAAALATYDGGGSPGSGAMWEIVTELYGKFPLGIDNNGVSFPFASVGGEQNHLLTTAEMPSHSHTQTCDGSAQGGYDNGGARVPKSLFPSAVLALDPAPSTGLTGGDTPHNNMPPYYTCYFLRRTARTDYIISPST
jgi:microcystin-dependent protein